MDRLRGDELYELVVAIRNRGRIVALIPSRGADMKKLILILAMFSSVCNAVPSDVVIFQLCNAFQVAQNEGDREKEYDLYHYLTKTLNTETISDNEACFSGIMKALR
ncbi:MAG: hypothetical protein ACRC5T_01290 [Cetobacterium sp.]